MKLVIISLVGVVLVRTLSEEGGIGQNSFGGGEKVIKNSPSTNF